MGFLLGSLTSSSLLDIFFVKLYHYHLFVDGAAHVMQILGSKQHGKNEVIASLFYQNENGS